MKIVGRLAAGHATVGKTLLFRCAQPEGRLFLSPIFTPRYQRAIISDHVQFITFRACPQWRCLFAGTSSGLAEAVVDPWHGTLNISVGLLKETQNSGGLVLLTYEVL